MTAVVGLVAAALTTGAWLPQIWQTWRTGSAADLSWGYLVVMACSMATWLSYGILADDAVVIVTNVATSVLVALLAALKVRHPRAVR